MNEPTHVLTKIKNADAIWIKGMSCALKMAGGGKIVRRGNKGFDVFAVNPSKLSTFINAR